MGLAGFDMVCVDGEYAPLDGSTLENLVGAAECVDMTPIFRCAVNHSSEVLPFLDTSGKGIMAPHVNTAEDAHRIVDAVK